MPNETKKELEAKFVGKKVIVTNLDENPKYFMPSMECYKENPFIVVAVDYSSYNNKYVLRMENPPNFHPLARLCLLPSWVNIIKDSVKSSDCQCNIFLTGCVCGFFKAEMQMKGKVYNAALRSWE